MINPEELQEFKEELQEYKNYDIDVLLQILLVLEIKKLNYNLSQIDFSLREMVK